MARKKSKKLRLPVVILLVVAIVVCFVLYKKGYITFDVPSIGGGVEDNTLTGDSSDGIEDIVTDELSIHFPMLGNKYSGDCTLIKVGNTEILIDAGSKKNSASALVPYIKNYCTDGVLEYVIATHAHEDHIAAFTNSKAGKGIFESYKCDTIIDFPRTDSTSGVYNDYVTLRDNEVENDGAKHYTALECWNNKNGAQRSYTLDEGITLNILYQKFYEEKASTENDYSVCVLLSQGNNHYLFTGDLEAAGEKSLVESNELPQCKLFKAGHHGSQTSSNAELMAVIRPEIVCVCCCCGNFTEYNYGMNNVFPSQAFIDRVSPYTDNIYVTTLYSATAKDGFEPLNGNIVVSSNGGEVKVTCSASDLILKETVWFRENRQWNG